MLSLIDAVRKWQLRCFAAAVLLSLIQAEQAGTIADQSPPTAAGTNRGVGYYAGFVTTDLQVDNKASGADMLKRSLQLAGTLL
jgi:hypothetical protein